jgi:streptomycin 6-kinase
MKLPDYLVRIGNESESNRLWVESLPQTIGNIKKEWKLKLGEPFLENVSCAYVSTCMVEDKFSAILKIGLPHEESIHEIDGLVLLNGNPTVKMLRFDRATNSMLLERCDPGTHLNLLPEPSQDKVLCSILPPIWNTQYQAGQFRPLSNMVALWNSETRRDLNEFPNPELAIKGCKLKEELVSNSVEHVLLATDLHAGNVLRAQRKDWLAIDIKPYIGDRTYDLTQHMLNCMERFKKDPIVLTSRISQLASINKYRLLKWMQARLLTENKGIHQEFGKRLIDLNY